MTEIKIDDHVLEVDLEKTKAYYASHSLCNCHACRNYYAIIKQTLPKVSDLLEQFGVDITKPDETGWADLDENGLLDYIFAAYTVNGSVKKYGEYEIDINDTLPIQIVINEIDVPNDQEGRDYFTMTLYHIKLPWVLDEPFCESKPEQVKGFFKRFFRKSKG